MREILFRGKRKDNGEWIEGSLMKITRNENECAESFYLIFQDNFSFKGTLVKAVGHAVVDPESVGQYAAMRDKNGKRIFEGDIIQIRFEGDAEPPSKPESWYETGKVIWHDQLHGWYVVFDSPDGIPIQEYDGCDDVFLVGNIHDNPELLGGA